MFQKVDTALDKLKDCRSYNCFEGVAMLVTCLPTSFSGYNRFLQKFFAIWATIENNAEWVRECQKSDLRIIILSKLKYCKLYKSFLSYQF